MVAHERKMQGFLWVLQLHCAQRSSVQHDEKKWCCARRGMTYMKKACSACAEQARMDE